MDNILADIAVKFRSDEDPEKRLVTSIEYEREVNRLIATREWKEAPPPQDMLPDIWMPLSFYRFWKL